MDFTFTEAQHDVAGLAESVFVAHCTPTRLKAADQGRFDAALWSALADAGILGLNLPEEFGGAGLGLLEFATLLVEAGRRVAPAPLTSHVPAAIALARFGTNEQQARIAGAIDGSSVLSVAVSEEREYLPIAPTVTARREGDGWVLNGLKVLAPSAEQAGVFLTSATTPDGVGLFLVEPGDAGVSIQRQRTSDGSVTARIEFTQGTLPADRLLGNADGVANAALAELLTLATSAYELGVIRGALDLTATYAKTREQFGRPIGTFQAVSQRLADCYIDVLGTDLMLWQAAWRLEEGLPAEKELAGVKLWAADAGHKVAHTTVHVHGGVGIDLDGEAHRYFTVGKLGELLHGGTTEQSRIIGAALASEPV